MLIDQVEHKNRVIAAYMQYHRNKAKKAGPKNAQDVARGPNADNAAHGTQERGKRAGDIDTLTETLFSDIGHRPNGRKRSNDAK